MTNTDVRLRPLLLALMLGIGGFALSACNTMEGMGQDIEAAGSSLENEAKDASD